MKLTTMCIWVYFTQFTQDQIFQLSSSFVSSLTFVPPRANSVWNYSRMASHRKTILNSESTQTTDKHFDKQRADHERRRQTRPAFGLRPSARNQNKVI